MVPAEIEESQTHIGDVEIALLMSLTDIFGETVNLDEGAMEALVVYVVDYSIHPHAVVLIPILVLLQVVQEGFMGIVKV